MYGNRPAGKSDGYGPVCTCHCRLSHKSNRLDKAETVLSTSWVIALSSVLETVIVLKNRQIPYTQWDMRSNCDCCRISTFSGASRVALSRPLDQANQHQPCACTMMAVNLSDVGSYLSTMTLTALLKLRMIICLICIPLDCPGHIVFARRAQWM